MPDMKLELEPGVEHDKESEVELGKEMDPGTDTDFDTESD
jgi:hypothetical protein